MIFTVEEGRDILRLDGGDNDEQILALLEAIPPYLTATTGYESVTGEYSPVARAAIAHHIRYLNDSNVNDPSISMNPDNLLAMCHACHNAEHFGSGGAVAKGYRFNADGDIIPTKESEMRTYEQHDKLHR